MLKPDKVKTGLPPKTKEQRQQDLNDKYGAKEYKLLEYRGTTLPAKVKHKCGATFEVTRFETLLRGNSKCACQHQRKFYKIERTFDDHVKEIKVKHGNKFVLIKFMGIGDSINIYKHTTCGKTFERSYNSFMHSKHCPHCAGTFGQNLNSITFKEVKARIKNKFDGQFKLVGEYTKMNSPALFKHSCGQLFYKKPSEFLRWNTPVCEGCSSGNMIARITEITINNKKFKVQGFEPLALHTLVKRYGEKAITSGLKEVRRFRFRFKRKDCSYIPDFIIERAKLVVEVKSLATLGLVPDRYLFFGEDLFERNCAKAKAVIKAGYEFQLWLYSSSRKRIKLPKSWYTLSKSALAERLNLGL